MINLGVIGLGPIWESYLAVLRGLRRPPQITAVYDPNTCRAEAVARPLNAKVATGIQALAKRSDVDAILLADVSWQGALPLTLLSQWPKPVFVVPWLPATLDTYSQWADVTANRGVTLMPAMWRRFMPVAVRLKELMATKLGHPQQVTVKLKVSRDQPPARVSETVLGWLDFICYLIPREPTVVAHSRPSNDPSTAQIELHFPPTKPHPVEGSSHQAGSRCLVRVHLEWTSATTDGTECSLRSVLEHSIQSGPDVGDWMQPEPCEIPDIDLQCSRGSARVLSRAKLSWTAENSTELTECLEQDRSERVVMLDHFFRRAVGGLVPVTDYHDVYRVLRIALAD